MYYISFNIHMSKEHFKHNCTPQDLYFIHHHESAGEK